MNQFQKQLESLKAQNARLKKAASDKLGPGYWGLNIEMGRKFTHEEIVFLFARIFQTLDFEFVNSIQTDFPDCKATKGQRERYIEFEPYLSNFKDHVSKEHDLAKCHYIVCWENDLEKHSPIRGKIKDNNIEVIELKTIWEATKIKKALRKPYEWTKDDFEKMTGNKLKVLSAFIGQDKNQLTKDEIGKIIKKKGRALGGSLKGFREHKHREWILKQTPNGWRFNDKYKNIIKEVLEDLEDFDML